MPIIVQAMTLRRKLTGHYAYYGITRNYAALMAFYRGVIRCWRKWLGRRSQNSRMPWHRVLGSPAQSLGPGQDGLRHTRERQILRYDTYPGNVHGIRSSASDRAIAPAPDSVAQ